MSIALATGSFVALGLLSTRSARRWPFVFFVVAGAMFLPLTATPTDQGVHCEFFAPASMVVAGLANPRHVLLFAYFFAVSRANLRCRHRAWWAFALTGLFGVLLEAEQAWTGRGHCRVRDVLPDLMGAAMAAAICAAWTRWRTRSEVDLEDPPDS